MAAKTFYFKNAVPSGATLHRSLQDGGSAPATATTSTGWVAGTNAAGQMCVQTGGTEYSRTGGNWGSTAQPANAPSQTIGDCWRSENTINGTFANTDWTFVFGARSVTAAYTGRCRIRVRVWKTSNANGASAVELTGSTQVSNTTSADMSTSADTTFTVTWSPGQTHTLVGEYLFVQVAFEITTAASSGTTKDFDFRVGSSYTVTTPDFSQLSMSAAAASFAWTGVDAFLTNEPRVARVTWAELAFPHTETTRLTCDAASFAWTGSAAGLSYKVGIAAEAAAFAWTGYDAGTPRTYVQDATSAATYVWTGIGAGLAKTGVYGLTADVAPFTWTGNSAGALWKHVMAADAASYSWTGFAASLATAGRIGRITWAELAFPRPTYVFPVQAGAFAWTGLDATLSSGVVNHRGRITWAEFAFPRKSVSAYQIVASPGAFTLTGIDVALLGGNYSVEVFWSDITGEDGYKVRWGTTLGGPYPNSATVGSDVMSYVIGPGLVFRTTYYWQVAGLVAGVEQTWSAETPFTVGIPPQVADTTPVIWTGMDAGLVRSQKALQANAGDFVETGYDAGLAYARRLTLAADPATFTLAASDAPLTRGRVLSGQWTGYTVSGPAIAWLRAYDLAADLSPFAWAGYDAAFGRTGSYQMVASAAAFDELGADAILARGSVMPADTAAFDWTVYDATLYGVRSLLADPTFFAVTGVPAALSAAAVHALPASPAGYFIVGNAASLRTDIAVFLPAARRRFVVLGARARLGTTHRHRATGRLGGPSLS